MDKANVHLRTMNPVNWIVALSIPRSDIERLSVRPLKWLRFVTFAVCGARGHLSATQDGGAADYVNVPFADLANDYYYIPINTNEDYCLIDFRALDDRITSAADTQGRSDFRRDVVSRDRGCVVTQSGAKECDAAHIIPHSKGDEYIRLVLDDRNHLYQDEEFDRELTINSIENGLLLRIDLQAPNFTLDPADIPGVAGVAVDMIPPKRTTMQSLGPPAGQGHWRGESNSDARITVLEPPSLLLDFMYGVAAYKVWPGTGIQDMLKTRHETTYLTIPPNPRTSTPEEEGGNEPSPPNDPDDADYEPSGTGRYRTRNHKPDMSDGMLQAMDDVLLLSMLLKGTSPQAIAAERQRRSEEAELRAQEAGRVKARQWLEGGVCEFSLLCRNGSCRQTE